MATLGKQIEARREQLGLTQAQLALRANWSQSRLSRAENDRAIPPHSVIVKLDEILNANGALIALQREATEERQRGRRAQRAAGPRHRSEELSATDRRNLITTAAGIVFGASIPQQVLSRLADIKARDAIAQVTRSDVDNFEATTALLADLDHKQGGGPTRTLLVGHLEWADKLAEGSCLPGVRARLQIAQANAYDLAAWATADAGHFDLARRLFLKAVGIAKDSEDSGILAHVATGWARMEIQAGDPKNALDLVRLARAGVDDLPQTAVAMLHTVSAMAHARIPDAEKCQRHLGLAEQTFRAPTRDDPMWLAYFTAAKMTGDAGTALYDLTYTTGRTRPALVGQLETAIRTYAPERVRSKAIAASRLATVLYRTKEPEQAGASAKLAAQLSSGVRSAWLLAALDEMIEAASAYPHDETVSSLTHTLARPRRMR